MIYTNVKEPAKRQYKNAHAFYYLFEASEAEYRDKIQFLKLFLTAYFEQQAQFLTSYQLYHSVVFELYNLLVEEKRYGEALYLYYALPYYFQNESDSLVQRYDIEMIKEELFKKTITAMNGKLESINVLYRTIDCYAVKSSGACRITEDAYAILSEKKKFCLEKINAAANNPDSCSGYHLVVVQNKDLHNSFASINAMRRNNPALKTPLCLAVESEKEAVYIYKNKPVKVDYLIYNKQMLFAVLHTILWNAGLLKD